MNNDITRHFLTVEWCNNGRRGIFCTATGIPYSKDTPLTTDEMNTYLDPFFIILAPKSIELSEQELGEYHFFIPLHEYLDAYGIVYKASNNNMGPRKAEGPPAQVGGPRPLQL